MRTMKKLATLGAAITVLSIGAVPLLTSAADHLDAPALGGTVVAGEIAPHSEHGDRDINDRMSSKPRALPAVPRSH